MRVSLELSLQKLLTSYIHLFYLHRWDYTVSIPELMHTLPIWWSAARSFTSGFLITRPGWLLRPINTFVITVYANSPCTKVVSFRGFEREILPMYRDENMSVVLWGTLSQGQFHTEAGYKEREQNNPGGKGRPSRMAREVFLRSSKQLQTQSRRILPVYPSPMSAIKRLMSSRLSAVGRLSISEATLQH